MSRNFGIGSRDLKRAGTMILKNSGASFSSVATNRSRWKNFSEWGQSRGLTNMEKINATDIVAYGQELAIQVKGGSLGLATAHNRISVVNRIFQLARSDKKVWASAVKDCGLPRRSGIAKANRALSEAEHDELCDRVPQVAILRELLRRFGLRFKEGALLDAKSALIAAKKFHQITVSRGTKGGKARRISITSPEQLAILEKASQLQDGRSMIPRQMSYVQFRRVCYRMSGQFHRERHSYAHIRYEALVGASCPIVAGKGHGRTHFRFLAESLEISIDEARGVDRAARLQVAAELGHKRKAITNAYYG